MIRADIYCRVSTAEQEREGYSLEVQERKLRLYCESHEWEINNVYIDPGFSGKDMNRPALQAMLEDVRQRSVDVVCVYKLDRFSRRQKDVLHMIEDILLPNDVNFVSMTETLDTATPFGMAMIGILAVFAQLERETIKERMWTGIEASVKQGNHGCGTGGRIPIGYDVVDKKFVINEYEAQAVRMVFERYTHFESITSIWQYMDQHYPMRDCRWSASRVHHILNCPLYIGMQNWRGQLLEDKDAPIILEREIWDRAKEMIERQKRPAKPQSAHRHVSMLGGLVFCGECGGRMCTSSTRRSSNGKVYTYYQCLNTMTRRNAIHPDCKSKSISRDKLDNIVIDEIKKLSVDRAIIIEKQKNRESAIQKSDVIKKKIADIQNQRNRLVDLYTMGLIDKETIQKKADNLSKDISALESELEQLETESATIQTINEKLDTFDRIASESDEKMDLYPVIHELISDITITNQSISINWNI